MAAAFWAPVLSTQMRASSPVGSNASEMTVAWDSDRRTIVWPTMFEIIGVISVKGDVTVTWYVYPSTQLLIGWTRTPLVSRHATVEVEQAVPVRVDQVRGLVRDVPVDVVRVGTCGVRVVVAQRGAGAVQRPFLGRVVDGHVEVEETPEVDGCRKQQQQDRQDERELDDALAAATIAATDHGTQGHRWTYSSYPRRP